MKKIFIILIPIVVLIALSFKNNDVLESKGSSLCDSLNLSAQEHLVMSVLWYQRSAEMKALYYQSFKLARMKLDEKLTNANATDKNAIVIDIDETVLDNSPYEAKLIEKGISFSSKLWEEWVKLAVAKPTPGVYDFLNYVKGKGVTVFYVSNRDMDECDATMKNMLAENLPFADTAHMLLRVNGISDKTGRYKEVAKNYKILLTIGDNLRDYNEIFGHRKTNYGLNSADSLKNNFGQDFIIMPNPMYGDWEKAIYGGKYPSEVEKSKLRKVALQTF
jgi:5'-nucleotidase (lipoprotein e(P4) family)